MALKAKKEDEISKLPIQYLFAGYYKNDVPLLLRTNEHGGAIWFKSR